MADYRCETSSEEGFIRRLAQGVVPHGAWFYVTGRVPGRYLSEPELLDEKLMAKYGVGVSRWTRYRRQERGLANVHYVRHGDFWVLIATKGRWHSTELSFHDENDVKDIRRSPIRFWGHSISYQFSTVTRRGKAVVRIEREEFQGLRGYFKTQLWARPIEQLRWEFEHLAYQPYGGVKNQYRSIIDSLNVKRKPQRLERIPYRIVDELRVIPVRIYEKEAA